MPKDNPTAAEKPAAKDSKGDHCCHADDDAQHGQARAHLIGRKCPQGYADTLNDVHGNPS